jgi:hypothetical protein
VVYDEGLRSYKAIAFIRGNPKFASIKLNCYFKLGANLVSTVLRNKMTPSGYFKTLGEKLWIN